jgi:hypothetical protein
LTRSLFWTGYALTSLPVVMPAFNLNPDPPQVWYMELFAMTIVSAWVVGGLIMLVSFARGSWLDLRAEIQPSRAHMSEKPETAM